MASQLQPQVPPNPIPAAAASHEPSPDTVVIKTEERQRALLPPTSWQAQAQPGVRPVRYKDKFNALREQFEQAVQSRDAYKRALQMATEKERRMQDEVDMLLDLAALTSPHEFGLEPQLGRVPPQYAYAADQPARAQQIAAYPGGPYAHAHQHVPPPPGSAYGHHHHHVHSQHHHHQQQQQQREPSYVNGHGNGVGMTNGNGHAHAHGHGPAEGWQSPGR